jgi:hypothetical protein
MFLLQGFLGLHMIFDMHGFNTHRALVSSHQLQDLKIEQFLKSFYLNFLKFLY